MVEMDTLADPQLKDRVCRAFGLEQDSMDTVERRARELLPDSELIVWEGDASTFQFSYVSESAERILGYPVARWTEEPAFWADTVVHPEDRRDAIAFCAMATGNGRDHDFIYRALAHDGKVVVLHDIVKVLFTPKRVPRTLRGIMLVVDREARDDRAEAGT